jgi:serine/threonine-protein kinase PpkA
MQRVSPDLSCLHPAEISDSVKIPGYTIIRELGSGGMATVYLARQDRLTRDVALKVMKPLAIAGDDFTSRFIKEGQIIAQLQHPQIVTIFDFDSTDGCHYFSMEYLPGGTLADEIGKGLPTPRAIAITKKIAEALAVAHARGVIHRDVKPQNILFRADGTPVLTDFGIARAVKSNADSMQLTSYGMVIGSPRYMSPEQSTGQPLDARSDLYSLGVVFYEMLTNQLPYQADDVVSLAMKHCSDPIPRLPDHLAVYQPILDKLIAKKPQDRFASAGQLIRALEVSESETRATGANDEATRLVVRGAEERTKTASQGRSHADRTGLRLLGAVLVLMSLAGVGLYLALRTQDDLPAEPSIAERLPAARAARAETATQYEKLAIEHVQKAQYEQGMELVRLGLSMTPDDTRLGALKSLIQDRIEVEKQLGTARELLRENLLDESLSLIESGLQRVPDHPGLSALRIELQDRLARRVRSQADALLARARSNVEAGQFDDALARVREGLGLVPDHPGLLQLQTLAQRAVERREAIQESIRQATSLLASGTLAESIAFIDRALESAPHETQLLDLRATAEKQLQRQREKTVAELFEQARGLMSEGDFQRSRSLIEEGLRIDPDHLQLQTLRDEVSAAQARRLQRQADELLSKAQRLFEQQAFDAALDLIGEGLSLAPEHAGLAELRARIAAVHQAENRVAQFLQDCERQFPLAERSAETGALAAKCYLQILTLDPTNARARERLQKIADPIAEQAESLLQSYRLDDAGRALEQLQSIVPAHPTLAALREDLKRRRDLSPAMIDIAGGCFEMGSPPTEAGREDDERQHQVCVKAFRLGQFELSVAEFKRFTKASGYQTDAERDVGGWDGCWALDQDQTTAWGYQPWASWLKPNKYQTVRDQDPISCVSWNDAQAYLRWLNQETGGAFRLPTEAEWEYAARAGSATSRFWGDAIDASACRYANTADAGHGWADGFPCNDQQEWVAPIGSFEPNAWGLNDLLGNLWEWTCSEYDAAYNGTELVCAPSASDAARILRGGAWNSGPGPVRSAYRNRNFPESRYNFVGFRLAYDAPAAPTAR